MEGQRVERRLAAILAADVAGYSRLMGADEEGTLAALQALLAEIVEPTIASHRGRTVKTTGDGVLADFVSAVDAARCAVGLQRSLAERNAAVADERRIDLRIGINVGDVIYEDGDIFGDGVNIAARLEALAEPGGIAISDDAYRQVRGKLDVSFTDAGEHQLKNIAHPVRIFTMRPASPGVRPTLPLPERPSIVILPFSNMSGEPDQEYFADGMVEDITTALSRFRWLFVIARNSSFTYKGRAVDVRQVGRELGVRYVLEGSVRKAGNRVRVNAQLVETTGSAHLWADRYDRDLSDIFEVQDEITDSVAQAIGPALAHAERGRASRKPPEVLDAWEAYHRGFWHFLKLEPAENDRAKAIFQRCLELDPSFAAGCSGIALCHVWDGWVYGVRPLEECVRSAAPWVQRALTLDPQDPIGHCALGWVRLTQGDLEGAEAGYRRAYDLNPSDAWSIGQLGIAYSFSGRRDEALAAFASAKRASPYDPLMWGFELGIAIANYYGRDFAGAAAAADRVVRLRPDLSHGLRFKAAALGQLGRLEEAGEALRQAIAVSPENFALMVRTRPPWVRAVDHALQLEGLHKAGLPED